MNKAVRALDHSHPTNGLGQHVSLGRHLIEAGLIAPWQLFHALDRQLAWDANLIEILTSRGWLSEFQALQIQSIVHTAQIIDLSVRPPDLELQDIASPEFCLKHNILPWQMIGNVMVIVTGRPDRFEQMRPSLPEPLASAGLALAFEAEVADSIAEIHRPELVSLAETRVAQKFSCRGWDAPSKTRAGILGAIFLTLALMFWFVPKLMLTALTLCALFSLIAVSSMKVVAALACPKQIQARVDQSAPSREMPRISVMVPLFREKEIAHALLSRLARLSYPKALLDVLLVLEEKDTLTQDTIARTQLPNWMRVVVVPSSSGLTTKPRALNYALDFCKGNIIGIWDAEDAPAPNQLEIVAEQFERAHPDTVCLQGVLDYYNPWTNWLSRCFTVEYATWFRTILPGLSKLGFAIPLGGTTLFVRRDALEVMGAWDAHNVTEDADLGMRIARFGWRTELLPTETQEEATCHSLAWIKQRSRWLKGFMVTYLVHMRSPRKLWKEFGATKFLGIQLVLACTLIQFLLAPLIWVFWGHFFGILDFSLLLFSSGLMPLITATLLFFGITDAVIATRSVVKQSRLGLLPFVLTMPFYFPLATLAAYKALFELLFKPYYWDKTAHAKTKEGISAHHSGVGVLFEAGHKSL